jgi:tight adherence protein B
VRAPRIRRGGARRAANAPRLDAVAAIVQRLAVLLAAGVTPASAWDYLDPESSPVVGAVSALVAEGRPVGGALRASSHLVPESERPAWGALAAAWQVATEAGAPLAPSLRSFASSLRSLADAQREIAVALAAPVATARLVTALPAVGIVFGMLLGFNTLGVLFGTVPGGVCLGIGMALMLVARAWNRRLVAAAQPVDLAPGLRCELTAIAVSGGAALDRAVESVERALAAGSSGADDGAAADAMRSDRAGVDAVLALSRRAGVPAGELLRSEAEEARRTARAAAAARASVLGVRLMLPLGLCILPAFMVLCVAPLLIAVVTSTISGM